MKLVAIVLVLAASAVEARASVTVFLERGGMVTPDAKIPKFGGGDRVWAGIVGCVREHYKPFAVDIVERQPARGHYITAVIGGRASQLGMNDRSTAGVAPYTGTVLRDAVVHVFSKSTGERDVKGLCASAAHEIGHALGLDHTNYCGDMMSYHLDRCGPRRFIEKDMPCGERRSRSCGDGSRTQNSYARLGDLVGFRDEPEPAIEDDAWADEDEPAIEEEDPWADERQWHRWRSQPRIVYRVWRYRW